MSSSRVLIRLLGPFQILKMGQPVSMRCGGKTEQLTSCLALHPRVGVHRATLVEQIWPHVPRTLAGQSLNTLMLSIKAQLTDKLAGGPQTATTENDATADLPAVVKVD